MCLYIVSKYFILINQFNFKTVDNVGDPVSSAGKWRSREVRTLYKVSLPVFGSAGIQAEQSGLRITALALRALQTSESADLLKVRAAAMMTL